MDLLLLGWTFSCSLWMTPSILLVAISSALENCLPVSVNQIDILGHVRVWPCVSNSVLFWCIPEASPKLFHVLWWIAYWTLHAMQLCTAPCIHASACLFVCLSVSPSRLFPLIDGQWTGAKSDCTHSIRRGLGRRLRSSLLLNSSPRCDPPCEIVYLMF